MNPDQYIQFCANLLGGRDRVPNLPKESNIKHHVEQEKKYAGEIFKMFIIFIYNLDL